MIDSRFDEVRKLIPALISKTDINNSNTSAIITEDNTLVICTFLSMLYAVKLSPESPLLGPLSFNVFTCMNTTSNETNEFCYLDNYEYNKIYYYYNIYYIECNSLLAKEENIVSNPNMIKYTSLKATDGIKFLKLFNYDYNSQKVFMVPIMSTLPNLNKGDDYIIKIYNYPYDNNSYCCEFVIWKKKIKRFYSIRFRILGG